MRWKYDLFPYVIVFAFILSVSFLSCGGQELASTWRDREVIIDGVETEWQGNLIYLGDENVALSLLNDDSYLYLCLATVDSRVVRTMIGTGLTVWFDPGGGKKEVFGINFPLGMMSIGENKNRESEGLPSPDEQMPDPERLQKMIAESAKEMVIIGPDKGETCRMPVASSQEIRVKLGYEGGKLIYELRVPLYRDLDHPDAIGLEDGQCIGLGFETTEMKREGMKERMRERMSGGTSGGGPGMRGGGMPGGGMPGGGAPGGRGPGGRGPDRNTPERLELWTKVRLSSAESAESL